MPTSVRWSATGTKPSEIIYTSYHILWKAYRISNFVYSYLIIPGTELLPNQLLIAAYLFALFYMFMGIAIVSDIFMDAIEVITSQT